MKQTPPIKREPGSAHGRRARATRGANVRGAHSPSLSQYAERAPAFRARIGQRANVGPGRDAGFE